MTWDDTDRTELDKTIDEIEQNAYDIGVLVGRNQERHEIVELLELEAKGDEVVRLIKKIEERK